MNLDRTNIVLVLIAFVAGGTIYHFFGPDKIKIVKEKGETKVVTKIEKEIEYKDRIVVKEVEKKITERIRVVKRREVFPDGHIIEEEIFESESEQIDRIRDEEKERYAKLLDQKEKELEEKYSNFSKVVENKRNFAFHFGVSNNFDNFITERPDYVFGASADVWGPFVLTGQTTINGTGAFLLGIKF